MSCSSKTRFLSLSCLFFAKLRPIPKRRIPSVRLSFTLRFCSGFHIFMIASLLFHSLSLFRLCFGRFDTCARFLTTHYSPSSCLLATKDFIALVTVLMKTSLITLTVYLCVNEVVELRLVLRARLLHSVYHFRSPPSSSPVCVSGICGPCRLFSHSFSPWVYLNDCYHRAVIILVHVPYHLQSDSRSNQDPTLVQSRYNFCRRSNVGDLGQSPTGSCEVRFASFGNVDHSQALLPQNVSEQRGRDFLFLCKEVVSDHLVLFRHRPRQCPFRMLRSVIMYGVLRFGVS